MNKQAKRYLENHFRFSGESNSNSVVVSLEENPIPTLDPVFVVPEHLVGFSDVPKRDLPLGQGHDIEAGVHFYQDDYRFNSFITRPGSYIMTANNTNNNDTMIIPFRAFVRSHAQDTFQQAQKPANKYTWVPNPEIQQVRDQLRRWTDRFGICRGLLAGALSFLWISLVAYNYAWSLSFQTLLWGASSLTLFTALTMWYKHYMYQQVILDGQRELMYALQFISRQLAGSNDHD